MPQNDFLPFATAPDANVSPQSEYAALALLRTGFSSGLARSPQMNKVWRQSSIMSAVLAAFIVEQSGQAAVDDGTTATLKANLLAAINGAVSNSFASKIGLQQDLYTSAIATGSADAIVAAFSPAITSTTLASATTTLTVRATAANTTTAPTFTPNSGVVAAASIVKGANQALAAGDIAGAGHWITLQWDATLSKWVLLNPATGVAPVVATGSFRNLLVNGAMRVAQQYGNTLQTPTTGTWVLDQWLIGASQSGKLTAQQVPGPSALGFDSYAQFTSASAYAIGANDFFALEQIIEGQNITGLAWGTPNAKPVSLQFVVNSSIAGTFSGALRNAPTYNMSYVFSFNIPQANVDTVITIPNIPGATAGAWVSSGTGAGLALWFSLGTGPGLKGPANAWGGNLVAAAGSVDLVATAGASLKITGIQLEVGPFCTPFERPTPEAENARCQRYLPCLIGIGDVLIGYAASSAFGTVLAKFDVPARAQITGLITSPLTGALIYSSNGSGNGQVQTLTYGGMGIRSGYVNWSITSGAPSISAGQGVSLYLGGAANKLLFTGAQL